MRYSDAKHVDVGSFYARDPFWGKRFRLMGYLFLVLVICHRGHAPELQLDLLVLVLLWFIAWKRVVGALWRSTLVAAMLLCAIELTMLKCPCAVMP